ncbi:nicotinamide N-methyltransferase [Malassezia vespertilionis]|uniref:Protein N-terminal and lysine N-methyltransferase EFM7 n=1 Tax=Malassezia vespertilionis TaxID=2020962 RepID=A0A2N1JAI5_9BASI|nr:nicotinamide N-methyltransferase [Malassezia vespertilionis]PKI83565.1 hypothetical protein MVES_002718 [Malassezia vespertilionis]WFD07505.1 nicotinamide N-methyltransferase [Malassezia vespertilionis]
MADEAEFSPSFGQPGTTFVYRPKQLCTYFPAQDAPKLPVVLPDAPMYMLFAHRLWRAGMLLADAIYTGAIEMDGKCVCELGAGVGLPALTAALCASPTKVVVTDYDDDDVINALRCNVRRTLDANPTMHPSPISIYPHTWGNAMDDVLDLLPCSASDPSPRFDVLLLADCIWERFAHASLLKSITGLLARRADARVYMVAGLHTGRAVLLQFLRRMLDAGFVLVSLPHLDRWPSLAGTPIAELPGAEHIMELQVDVHPEGSLDSPGVVAHLRCCWRTRRQYRSGITG